MDKKSYPAFIFMLRPLNLIEHHCIINGKEVLGSLFDFSMIMFHNAKHLSENNRGPYLCLSKVPPKLMARLIYFLRRQLECAEEVHLWIKVLAWTESKLNIAPQKIKVYP
jgi:malate synthase